MLKIQDIVLNKIRVSKEKFYNMQNKAYKHFILYEYNNNEFIPLLIRLPETTGCLRVFADDKRMNFLCEDDELLDKYEEIFRTISNKIGIEFSSEPTTERANGTNIKIKVHKAKSSFYNNKLPEEDTNYTWKILIRTESVYLRPEESKFLRQTFLEKWKYRLENRR